MKKFLLISVGVAALVVAGCKSETEAPQGKMDAPAAQVDAGTKMAGAPKAGQREIGNRVDVMTALQHNDRPAADKEDDDIRKAAGVLQFSKIWPGETVIELEAGSGYYTEIMSRIVGKDGSVLMQNPQSFDAFVKPEVFEARLGADGNRLGNVTHSRTNFDLIDAPDASADLVTWFLGPHELWLKNKEGELTLGAPDKVYAEIFRVLKPGGRFVALDHKAAAGSPVTTGGDTHRIDPAHVQAAAEKAGLVLTETSDILANKADDYNIMVFDPKVRRKTDRFLHLYTKPK